MSIDNYANTTLALNVLPNINATIPSMVSVYEANNQKSNSINEPNHFSKNRITKNTIANRIAYTKESEIVKTLIFGIPTANDDIGVTLTEDGADGIIDILANDTDPDGNPTAPVNGTGQFKIDLSTTKTGIQTTVTNPQGVWTLDTNTGIVRFDPADNYNGTATLVYKLIDSISTTLNSTATITFEVKAVNDVPIANDDKGANLTEDGTNGTKNILANDTDLDGNPIVPVNGEGQFKVDLDILTAGIQTNISDVQGVWTLDTATGIVTFDPADNYFGTATLTYVLTDSGMTPLSDTAVITFKVNSVNDAPVANDDSNATILSVEGARKINPLSATDIDGNIESYTILSLPTNGTLALLGISITKNQILTPLQVNSLTYEPDGIFIGNDTFMFTATDNNGAKDQTPATITIPIIKSSIIAKDDAGGMVDGINGEKGFVNILINDTLEDLVVNSIEAIITGDPNPSFVFHPDGMVDVLPNTKGGNYTLTYTICEKANLANCSSAKVTVFVAIPRISLTKTAKRNDENEDGFDQVNETISYSFEIKNTGNTVLSAIDISDTLPGVDLSGSPIILEAGEKNTTNFKGKYTITQADINFGSITNKAKVFGTSPNGIKSEDISEVVLVLSKCEIHVFNAIAPDSSLNNKFYIQGIECYPDNKVQIFNRRGVLVYEHDNYNNVDKPFIGISDGNVKVSNGQELIGGTYFYTLKCKDGNSGTFEKSGYLYLSRK